MKIKITLSYDGTHYNGSQIQPSVPTIQSELLKTLKIINIDSTLDFSGRTDKGVHAFKQVVSCTVPSFWKDTRNLKIALNRLLPNALLIRDIKEVEEEFHARFSAIKREYRYLLSAKKLTPFNANYISYYETINEKKINEAIQLFIGIHDFEYFRKKASDPISTVREIYSIHFYKHQDIFVLHFKANSYLRSQIRMIVDFIMKISSGKLSLEDLHQQLNVKKLISWTLAPASGLYLSKIHY
ncbi:MAG: tRNA pseudouridine(38-40) synthase TruA [Arcobacteraceae bacterium]